MLMGCLRFLWLLVFLQVLIYLSTALIITQFELLQHFCMDDTGDYTNNSVYRSNLDAALSSITSNINATIYGFSKYTSFGQNSDTVNALALCRGDVDQITCGKCVYNSTVKLRELCPNQKEAIVWYDYCMLRYYNPPILQNREDSLVFFAWNTNNVSDAERLNKDLMTLLDKIRPQASGGGPLLKLATGNESTADSKTIYGLVQCTPNLSEDDCNNCLSKAVSDLPKCCVGRRGGKVVRASCNIRYEMDRFFMDTPTPSPDEDDITTAQSLQCNFWTIRTATDNFSESNKLGQGGFGAVYKGKLENGSEIAVKRLSVNSGQGDLEFKNEVGLVAKLQHRNLIRLLGFCLEGIERLLIYEFMPNASLDHFIFDPMNRAELDWERRLKIILGIARGLLYLHEDSRLRIIHRDLKASNILLDSEMNPKIADFGLARLFEIDETQGNTSRIVGTYGYMAPEYAMHGQFSVKSDVFSFGVMVLEIISGQRNNCFRDGENVVDLLSSAWKNWQERGGTNLIDPVLRSNANPIRDIMRCIHIGLLCVQENVADRPTMASIVLMLNSFSITLPVPSEPTFFMHSSVANTEKPLIGEHNSEPSKSSEWKNVSSEVSNNSTSITELYPR